MQRIPIRDVNSVGKIVKRLQRIIYGFGHIQINFRLRFIQVYDPDQTQSQLSSKGSISEGIEGLLTNQLTPQLNNKQLTVLATVNIYTSRSRCPLWYSTMDLSHTMVVSMYFGLRVTPSGAARLTAFLVTSILTSPKLKQLTADKPAGLTSL